jgi:hypothetical protein
MPITPSVITSAIMTAGAADLKGPNFPRVATAVGNVVASWSQVPINLALSGTTTGQAGAGVVTGKITVSPAVSVMTAAFASAGLKGPTAPLLAKAISIGIATAFSSVGAYTGSSVGVAVGSDVSKITVANSVSLIPVLSLALAAALQGVGPNVGTLSIGLGNGITAQLLTGTGVGVVAGTPAPTPAPSVGTSPLSKVF